MRFPPRSFAIASLCVAAKSAVATATSLNFIPIADILAHRAWAIDYTMSGYERRIQPGYEHSAGLAVGLNDRIEFGFNHDLVGEMTGHGKVLLWKTVDRREQAISAGFLNWRAGRSNPYVVGRQSVGDVRLHAGWLNWERSRIMLGADFPVVGKWVGLIDFASGPGGALWFGMETGLPFSPGLNVLVSVGLPNTRSEGIQHAVNVAWVERW
jgi:hypothetical protein